MLLKKQLNQAFTTNRENGFSLITISMALAIIGLLGIPALHMYNISVEREKVARNKTSTLLAAAALNKHFLLTGYYPRPASPGAALGNAAFGHAVPDPGPGLWPDCQNPATPDNVVCSTTLNTVGGESVLIGVVPFADLSIPFTSVLDANKNLLTYAVTRDQTSPGTFLEDGGRIIVIGSTGVPIYSSGSRSHFVVTSHGNDGRGAYGQNGLRNRSCSNSSDSTDFENCNKDGTFRSNLVAGTIINEINDGAGSSHFDDYVQEKNSTASGIWSFLPNPLSPNLSINDRMGGNVATGDCDGRSPCIPVSRFDVYGNNSTNIPAVRATQINTTRFCGRGNAGGDVPGSGNWNCVNDPASVVNTTAGDELTSTCIGTVCPPLYTSWDMTNNIPPWFTPQIIGGTLPSLLETDPQWMSEANHQDFHRGKGIGCIGGRALNGIFNYDESCSYTGYLGAPSISKLPPCASGTYARGIKATTGAGTGGFFCQTPAENM